MLPLLKLIGDKKEYSLQDTISILANQFNLTEEERHEMLPSGQQPVFINRVGWARTYMKKAGLIEPTRRGYFRITERGITVLKQNPSKIDAQFLLQFPEFREFYKSRQVKPAINTNSEKISDDETPKETLENAYQKLQSNLMSELLEQVRGCSPAYFEKIVLDLLVKMGYGGNRKDAEAVGKSGDGGIDGIIKEDRLGLDTIYVQAKRWQGKVGEPVIRDFAGSLLGKHAKKGVLITTSDFSDEVHRFVSQIDSKVILINGDTLAKLMIEHGVGVATSDTYEIKRIDVDYFNEE